jgi:hypothetical protein
MRRAPIAVVLALMSVPSEALARPSAARAEARRRLEALEAEPSTGPARRRRFRAWRRAAKRAGAPRRRLYALTRAELAVDRVARRPKRGALAPTLRALARARRTLRRHRFRARAAWVRALALLVRARSGDPAGALRAGRGLRFRGVPAARRLALEARAEAALARDRPARALELAARAAGVGAQAPERLETTPLLRRACAALADPRRCPHVVHARTGAFLVSGFEERAPVQARSDAVLERIHAQASVLLRDCLLAEARAEPDRLRGAQLEISWTIAADGRVRSPDVRPKRHRDLLDGCLPERLGWLRYPKLASGAHENVSMRFGID